MKVLETKNAPGAIGPYSQGFEVNGFVYTSGQIPVDPATGGHRVVRGSSFWNGLETAAATRHGARHGLVIACGGGTPLRAENRRALAANGRVYYLEADCDRLSGAGRPLSSSPEAIRALYDARRPVYKAFADVTIPDSYPAQEAEAIAADFLQGDWAGAAKGGAGN